MSMCRVFSCVVGRGCLPWPVRSLGKILSLCPASFCIPRPNLRVTPGGSWLPTFAFQSLIILESSKITADGDCSHEIKRHLLLGRKVMTKLDNIFKSRDITLPTKVRLVKAMVFPVVMYGCESWTVKKAEHWRTDAFELWCWRRLLTVPGLQGDPTSPFWRRSALGFLWKEWC